MQYHNVMVGFIGLYRQVQQWASLMAAKKGILLSADKQGCELDCTGSKTFLNILATAQHFVLSKALKQVVCNLLFM